MHRGIVAGDDRSCRAADADRNVPHLREILADHVDLAVAAVVALLLLARECALRDGVPRGGFFIHDAPWEPSTGFGPGSQNGLDASHGCVHIPTPTMAWLYSWSPIGTTVIIHPEPEAVSRRKPAWRRARSCARPPGDRCRSAGW